MLSLVSDHMTDSDHVTFVLTRGLPKFTIVQKTGKFKGKEGEGIKNTLLYIEIVTCTCLYSGRECSIWRLVHAHNKIQMWREI